MRCTWLRCLGVTTIILSILVASIRYKYAANYEIQIQLTKDNKNKLKTWYDLKKYGIGYCDEAIYLKNAFPNNNTINSLISRFGDKKFEMFTSDQKHKEDSKNWNNMESKSVFVSLSDYYSNDKYLNDYYYTYGQLQVFNHDEYCQLLNCNDSYDPYMTSLPLNKYAGAHVFIGRGVGTGAALHFEWGRNLFINLSGQKHWISVNSKHLQSLNCTFGELNGVVGQCNIYGLNSDIIDAKQFKSLLVNKYNIPSSDVYDQILSPGDAMFVCDLQPHLVENLTPNVFAMSLRFGGLTNIMQAETYGKWSSRWRMIYQSIYQSLMIKFKGLTTFTFLDVAYHRLMQTESYKNGLYDFDPRFKGAAYHTQKKQN